MLRLGEPYPNPFNPSTSLRFSIAHGGHASLRVYALSGVRVATLFEGPTESGQTYVATWNSEGVTSGVYVACLSALEGIATQKLLLVK
jgi:hypothetical protein